MERHKRNRAQQDFAAKSLSEIAYTCIDQKLMSLRDILHNASKAQNIHNYYLFALGNGAACKKCLPKLIDV